MTQSDYQQTAPSLPRGDWRNPERYQSHLEYDCIKWAGEWICRNSLFLADWQRAPCRSRPDGFGGDGRVRTIWCMDKCPMTKWGLRCCRIDGVKPTLLWLPEYNPQILTVEAEIVASEKNAVDLQKCQLLKTAFVGAEKEINLLFTDEARTLQVVLKGVSDLEKPIVPRCILHGMDDFTTKSLTLQRLCCLYKRGRLVKSLYPGERRSRYWLKMLQAYDGAQSGAHHREIGVVIFGEQAVREAWDDGYRLRVQRLIRSAKRMAGGEYLTLLQPRSQKHGNIRLTNPKP